MSNPNLHDLLPGTLRHLGIDASEKECTDFIQLLGYDYTVSSFALDTARGTVRRETKGEPYGKASVMQLRSRIWSHSPIGVEAMRKALELVGNISPTADASRLISTKEGRKALRAALAECDEAALRDVIGIRKAKRSGPTKQQTGRASTPRPKR
jgi:hypothetical protein